jgi:hypothetical protein
MIDAVSSPSYPGPVTDTAVSDIAARRREERALRRAQIVDAAEDVYADVADLGGPTDGIRLDPKSTRWL